MNLSEMQRRIERLSEKVERLEDKLELYTNPAKEMSIDEKANMIFAAMETGDKKELRAVTRFINGE